MQLVGYVIAPYSPYKTAFHRPPNNARSLSTVSWM